MNIKKRKIFYKIISSSMLPSLSPGDYVICGEKRPEDINVGDIVVINKDFILRNNRDLIFFSQFRDEEFSIIHRVIHKEKKDGQWYFKTKGDNNSRVDGGSRIIEQTDDYILVEYDSEALLIPESEIIGVVFTKVPKICPRCDNKILDEDMNQFAIDFKNDGKFILGKFKKVELKFYFNN